LGLLGSRDAYLRAVANGTQQIFLIGALCAAAAFVASVFIQQVPLRSQPSAPDKTVP